MISSGNEDLRFFCDCGERFLVIEQIDNEAFFTVCPKCDQEHEVRLIWD